MKMVEGKIVANDGQIDPTTPRRKEQVSPLPSSSLKHSLSEVVKRINARGATGSLTVLADPSLAPKTLCLVGEHFLTTEELLKAVADVYGLHVRRGTDTARITLPLPKVLTSPEQIEAETWRLLPAPFVRAVRNTGPADPRGALSYKRAFGVYEASIRRLREIVEPEIARRAGGKLPMREVSEEALNMVALSSLATCIDNFNQLTRPAAAFVTHFDKATLSLSASSSGNRTNIDYSIHSTNDEGKPNGVGGSLGFPTSLPRKR